MSALAIDQVVRLLPWPVVLAVACVLAIAIGFRYSKGNQGFPLPAT